MENRSKFIVLAFVVLFSWVSGNSLAQSDETIIRGIADRILLEHVNQYVSRATKKVYHSTDEIPVGEDVYYKSPYMEWYYSMGVLDLAMIHAGNYFNEKKYLRFVIDHVDYAFANEPFFEKRREQYPKGPFHAIWEHKELDHCGAMGATLIELDRINPQADYKAYIKKTATHISDKQARFSDGTLARTWPYPLTLWADNLYMALSFLTYMGSYSGKSTY